MPDRQINGSGYRHKILKIDYQIAVIKNSKVLEVLSLSHSFHVLHCFTSCLLLSAGYTLTSPTTFQGSVHPCFKCFL